MRRLALLLSFCAAAVACASRPRTPAVPPDPDQVERLIGMWEARDGATFVEVGSSLSEALVEAPDDFFFAMSAHPSSFDSWLSALPQSAFTAYASERLPAIAALLPAMRSVADRFRHHPQYGDMATRLSKRLSSVSIREID